MRLFIFIIIIMLFSVTACKERQKALPTPSPSAHASSGLASGKRNPQTKEDREPAAKKSKNQPANKTVAEPEWDVPKPKFEYVPRKKWGAGPAKPGMERISKLTGFVIMHTGGGTIIPEEDEERRLRGAQAYHMNDLGWHDIGYHWAIGPSGKIYEGRSEKFKIDSSYQYRDGFEHRDFIAIVLLGDYSMVKAKEGGKTAPPAEYDGGQAGAGNQEAAETEEEPELQPMTNLMLDGLNQVLCNRVKAYKLKCGDVKLAEEVGNTGENPGSYFSKYWLGNLAVDEVDPDNPNNYPLYGGSADLCTSIETNKYP
jgi:hypothetical protein